MRERLYQITRQTREDDFASQIYDLFIVVISCLSIVPLMFRDGSLLGEYYRAINYLELMTVYLLAFDYLLGWSSSDFIMGKKGWRSFARYPFTLAAIIELLSILPSLGVVPGWLRILRLFMLTRLIRYSRPLAIVSRVMIDQKRSLLSVFYVTLVYIFASALFMFLCEPEMFGDFFEALYWSVTAVTTVGYGDIVPVTDLGRLVGMLSSLVGIAVIALPSGIMTAGYMAQLHKSTVEGEDYFENVVSLKKLREMFVRNLMFFRAQEEEDGGRKGPLHAIWSFIRRNPKFCWYAVTMFVCLLLDVFFYQLASRLGLAFWLDMTGTAIAAILLEPVAGVIVGFANNMVLSFQIGNSASLLFFVESGITAVAFGLYFHWTKLFQPKNFLRFVFLAIVLEAVVDAFFHIAFSQYVICLPWQIEIREWIEAFGCPLVLSVLFECAISKLIDIPATAFLAAAFVGIIRDTKLDPAIMLSREDGAQNKKQIDGASDCSPVALTQEDDSGLSFISGEAVQNAVGYMADKGGIDVVSGEDALQVESDEIDAEKASVSAEGVQEINALASVAEAASDESPAYELAELISAWEAKRRAYDEGSLSKEDYESWKAQLRL